jgi:hypothetical protein
MCSTNLENEEAKAYFGPQRSRKKKYGGSRSNRKFCIHFLNTQNNTKLVTPQCREILEVEYLAHLKREVA